jgi:hypothetical protein
VLLFTAQTLTDIVISAWRAFITGRRETVISLYLQADTAHRKFERTSPVFHFPKRPARKWRPGGISTVDLAGPLAIDQERTIFVVKFKKTSHVRLFPVPFFGEFY